MSRRPTALVGPPRPCRGRGALGLWAALLASGCELSQSGPPAPDAAVQAPSPAAHLEHLRGSVTLERDGNATPAVLGYLYPKDALETGKDSQAQVRFPGGRLIEIGPDARFSLTRGESGVVLQFDKGALLSRVTPGAAGAMAGRETVEVSILTPFGVAQLGTGDAQLSIALTGPGAKLDVEFGSVEFIGKNGQNVRASAGDALTLEGIDIELTSRAQVLQPLEVVIEPAKGKADIRKKGSKRWRAVSKKGDALDEGDGLRVANGSIELSLQGSESHLSIEGGSEIVYFGTGASGKVEETKVDLKKGKLALNLSPRRKSRVAVGGLMLESDLGGFFLVTKTRSGVEVSAIAGELKLKREGMEDQALRSGQRAVVGAQKTQLEASRRSALVLPSRQGLRVFHPALGQATIVWEGEPREYRVEVAADSAFKAILLAGTVDLPELTLPIPRKGALHWRVTHGGQQLDRGSAAFAPEPPTRDLDRDRNEVTEGGEKATIYYQDQLPAVTLSYRPEPGADRYRVAVFRADALDKPLLERTVAEGRTELEAGLLPEGSYLWSATPLSKEGAALRGGKMNKLELVYDNSVPGLLLRSPRNGQGAAPKVTASGVAPVGSRLFVNGRAAPLDDKHRFSLEAAPVGDPPSLVFRLDKPGQPDVYTVRVLGRRR